MQVVSHDLYERAYMIQSAPFMTHALPMMIPLKHYWEIPMMWVSGAHRIYAHATLA
jgi:glycerol-3-phosphate dehydrogenase